MRFDPLALVSTAAPVTRKARAPKVPRTSASPPRYGQFDEAIRALQQKAVDSPETQPTPPAEQASGEAAPSSSYQLAVAQAFARAGYADAAVKVNVFTFRQWLAHGRCVQRGQKAVRVDIQVPRGKPVTMVTKPIWLFHESQTRPLTEPRDVQAQPESKAPPIVIPAPDPAPEATTPTDEAAAPVPVINVVPFPSATRPVVSWKTAWRRS